MTQSSLWLRLQVLSMEPPTREGLPVSDKKQPQRGILVQHLCSIKIWFCTDQWFVQCLIDSKVVRQIQLQTICLFFVVLCKVEQV